MASVESRLKLIEQVDFKDAFTDAEFESYRNMFMVRSDKGGRVVDNLPHLSVVM